MRFLFLTPEQGQALKAFSKSAEYLYTSHLLSSQPSLIPSTNLRYQQAPVTPWTGLVSPQQGHLSSKPGSEHTLLCHHLAGSIF